MDKHVIDVPQLVRAERQDRVAERQMQIRTLYQPPLDGSPDLYREIDLAVARKVIGTLDKEYPGYPWHAKCNAQQGVVYFSIPALMGETLVWLIKLRQWEEFEQNGEHLVRKGGGQLLERMGLPRKAFDADSFVKARDNKHLLDFADVGRRRVV